ncbi:MAG: transposase [Candidatus Marinimicrobia bacterium]|nr:transposase [Candidatus Neomarinimicrobiota bacterium]
MFNSNTNVQFSRWISQVVDAVRPQLLSIVKESLEKSLIQLRDQQIGNNRYERNNSMKRYGFRIRGEGKRVLLTALGVDSSGHVHVLDWLVEESEGQQSWLRLLQRLRQRGLGNVRLIVGDGSLGLPAAGKAVFPESQFQICLWHLCRDLMRQVKGLNWIQRQHLYHDFWEVFNALTLDECYERYLTFLRKWNRIHPAIERLFARYETHLFYYYDFS